MAKHHRRVTLLSVLLSTGWLLGACGGSADAEGERVIAPSTTSSLSVTPSALMANDPFCRKISEAAQKFGLGPSIANLGSALQQLPDAASLLTEALALAPQEIKADIASLAGTLEELTPLLTKIATLNAAAKTDVAAAAEMQKATLELIGRVTSTQSGGFTTSVANLRAYSEQNCGVKFG